MKTISSSTSVDVPKYKENTSLNVNTVAKVFFLASTNFFDYFESALFPINMN